MAKKTKTAAKAGKSGNGDKKPNPGKFSVKPEGERRTHEQKVYVTPAFHEKLAEFVKRLNGEAFRPRLVADYYRLAVESQLEADLQKEAKKNARRAGK